METSFFPILRRNWFPAALEVLVDGESMVVIDPIDTAAVGSFTSDEDERELLARGEPDPIVDVPDLHFDVIWTNLPALFIE